MTSHEGAAGNPRSPEHVQAIRDLNFWLGYASLPIHECLSEESAARILRLQENDAEKRIDDIVHDLIEDGRGHFGHKTPLIPGVRSVDDFPVGTAVYLKQDDARTSYMCGNVYNHIFSEEPWLDLQFELAHSYVIPGYVGLVSKADFDFYNDEVLVRGRPSVFLVNLKISQAMTKSGFGNYSTDTIIGYLVRQLHHKV